MHYFCYISAYKVEQYLAQLPDRVADQESRTKDSGSTHEVDGKLGGLWNLLSFGAKYGRSDKIQSQVTRRTHLVEKLLFLISALEQQGKIAWLEEAINVGTSHGYDMLYVRKEKIPTRLRAREWSRSKSSPGAVAIEVAWENRILARINAATTGRLGAKRRSRPFRGSSRKRLRTPVLSAARTRHQTIATGSTVIIAS